MLRNATKTRNIVLALEHQVVGDIPYHLQEAPSLRSITRLDKEFVNGHYIIPYNTIPSLRSITRLDKEFVNGHVNF